MIMSRKREATFMGIGILVGLALSGPAAQAATNITATLSTQPIYVDGQRMSMTAYSISGNNYVRLRDIGRAIDFGVTYDAATKPSPAGWTPKPCPASWATPTPVLPWTHTPM